MFTPEQWDKIQLWSQEDPTKLRLKYHGIEWEHVIDQVECRRRASKKLRDIMDRCPHFVFPHVLSSEQCTSETFARYHASLFPHVHKVLDLTSGLGIDALAFAENHAYVTATDINPRVTHCLQINASNMGFEDFKAINADCTEYIHSVADDEYDLVFIDPARRDAGGKRVFALGDCLPDVTVLLPDMLRVAPTVMIKLSPMLDITSAIDSLTYVRRVIVTGTERECREILLICERDYVGEVTLDCATVFSTGHAETFSFSKSMEANTLAQYGLPTKGDTLYEPYPNVIKAGAFNILSERLGVKKLAPNSHLYWSSEETDVRFPGKKYHIIAVDTPSKKGLGYLRSITDKADFTTRNFTMTAEQLAAKSKIRWSHSGYRIFGTRDANHKPIVILTCEKPSP